MKKTLVHCIALISLITSCICQTIGGPQTEPKLTSVLPVNSTALTVNWQFANTSVDQSDLIQISIIFYEFYLSHNQTYASNNYTFTSANKTITNLTKNFEFVNAYYYVCLLSNSLITDTSQVLSVVKCVFTRTCLRSNTACPGPSIVSIQSTSITSNSFSISFLWPNDLPYTPISFSAQLTSTGQLGTSLDSIKNESFTNYRYQFTGLQSNTNYQVNTSFNYSFMNNLITTNTSLLTVQTSLTNKLDCLSIVCLIFFSVMSKSIF